MPMNALFGTVGRHRREPKQGLQPKRQEGGVLNRVHERIHLNRRMTHELDLKKVQRRNATRSRDCGDHLSKPPRISSIGHGRSVGNRICHEHGRDQEAGSHKTNLGLRLNSIKYCARLIPPSDFETFRILRRVDDTLMNRKKGPHNGRCQPWRNTVLLVENVPQRSSKTKVVLATEGMQCLNGTRKND